MTKEDKDLLLKDLYARILYGFAVHRYSDNRDITFGPNELDEFAHFLEYSEGKEFKPYLRPMSSMTEKEFELLKQYSGLEYDQLDLAEFPNNHKYLDFYLSEVPSYVVILVFDWLNAHHFDYRLLIEMGLALEAPEGMYKKY